MPGHRPDGDRRVRVALAVFATLTIAYSVVIARQLLLGILVAAALGVCYLGWRLLRALERYLHVRADAVESGRRAASDGVEDSGVRDGDRRGNDGDTPDGDRRGNDGDTPDGDRRGYARPPEG